MTEPQPQATNEVLIYSPVLTQPVRLRADRDITTPTGWNDWVKMVRTDGGITADVWFIPLHAIFFVARIFADTTPPATQSDVIQFPVAYRVRAPEAAPGSLPGDPPSSPAA